MRVGLNIESDFPPRVPGRVMPAGPVLGGLLIAATAIFAWFRVGLLDLPSVPAAVTLESAGLSSIDDWSLQDGRLTDRLHGFRNRLMTCGMGWANPSANPSEELFRGIVDVRGGDEIGGLWRMSDGVNRDRGNLVLANCYRMEVFRLRREFLKQAREQGKIAPQFPLHLAHQPITFFEELVRIHPSRETKLSLALAWVDEMLLFPALEIKAPASVQSVDILTEILESPGNDWYVPALFARGLNHLHRPARLVWPESDKTGPDAAVRDIARCVAIGRKFGVGSARLQATLAMTLGDAYVKVGRYENARSWWQIARNLSRDADLQSAIGRRFGWRDEDMIDRLEAELDRARSELDHPMTDLAFMWN